MTTKNLIKFYYQALKEGDTESLRIIGRYLAIKGHSRSSIDKLFTINEPTPSMRKQGQTKIQTISN